MKTRPLCAVVALILAGAALNASAQFPKIKKPKEEKPAPATTTTTTESKPAASSTPATSSDTMKKVTWADNGISFEVPDNWEQTSLDKDFASFSLPNSEGVGVSMNISRLGKDFPADKSLQAYQDSAAKEKSEGKLAKWENQNIGAAKGLNQLEAATGDDICRLTWLGYQNRGGWNMVTVIFSSKGSAMSNHEATFRKVLGTFKIE